MKIFTFNNIIAWGLDLNFLLNIQALMSPLKYFMPMITIDLKGFEMQLIKKLCKVKRNAACLMKEKAL